jgi:hypothetical protein
MEGAPTTIQKSSIEPAQAVQAAGTKQMQSGGTAFMFGKPFKGAGHMDYAVGR